MALRPSHLTKSVRIVAISAIVSASLGLGGAALAETPATPTAPTLSPGSLPSRSASTAIHHLASAPAEVTTVDAERLAQVNSTDDYGDVVISPNSMTAYLSVPAENEVAVLNLASDTFGTPIPVGTAPEGLDISADGSTLYVCDSGGQSISVVNTVSGTVTSTIATPAGNDDASPWQIALGDNDTAIYTTANVVDEESGEAYVLNLASDTSTVATGIGLDGFVYPETPVARSGDYSTAAVDFASGELYVYSFASGETTGIAMTDAGNDLALNETGSSVIVSSGDESAAYIVDTTTHQTVASLGVGGFGVATNSTGTTAYATEGSDIYGANTTTFATDEDAALTDGGTASGPLALSPNGATLVTIDSDGVSIIPTASLATLSPTIAGTSLAGTTATMSGTVTNSVSAALAGVCIFSSDSDGFYATAVTNASGQYSLYGLTPGTYTVEFDPTCDFQISSPDAIEYWNGQSVPSSAEGVILSATASVSGISAALPAGATVGGQVSAPDAGQLAGMCVYSVYYDTFTGLYYRNTVTSASSNGTYALTNLAPGNYWVYADPTCDGEQPSDYTANFLGEEQTVAAGQIDGAVDGGLPVYSLPALGSSTVPNATQAVAYSTLLEISGGTGPYVVSNVSGLPASLTFNPTTLTISGTPTSSGNYSVTLTITDVGSFPEPAVVTGFSLDIAAPPGAATLTPATTTTTSTTTTTTTTTTTLAAKKTLVCKVVTHRAAFHKVEIRDGKRKTITIYRVVDLTKRIASHVWKRVHGKRVRVTVYRIQLVKRCTLVTS